MLDYKEWWERRSEKKFTKDMNVFWTVKKPYVPLSYVDLTTVQRSLENRSGVKFGWHDGRRFVQTALEEARLSNNWIKKIKGRRVRGEEAPYSLPAIGQLREAFRKAVPHLLFRTTEPQVSKEELRREVFEMLPDEMLKPVAKKYGVKIRKLRSLMAKTGSIEQPNSPASDPMQIATDRSIIPRENMRYFSHHGRVVEENHQKIVNESELPNYLDKGWYVVSALPSGKVVIARNNHQGETNSG